MEILAHGGSLGRRQTCNFTSSTVKLGERFVSHLSCTGISISKRMGQKKKLT